MSKTLLDKKFVGFRTSTQPTNPDFFRFGQGIEWEALQKVIAFPF